MKVELQDGAPPGTGFACHSSGWMQLDIFTDWFKHFLKFSKPTEDDPALLILDGHNTHTKNLDFIELARKNHTTVLCLPPHCSHRLQPLDVSFMGPVNKYYIRAVEKYLRNNPGRAITVFQFSKLFGEAYSEAAQQSIAVNGFRKCGIEPIDRHVFKDHDFLAADTTDVALAEPEIQQNEANKENETPEREESPSVLQDALEEILAMTPPLLDSQADTLMSPMVDLQPSTITSPMLDPQPSTSFAVTPKDLFPIPKALPKTKKINRKRGRTAILTSSPYKQELQEEKTQQEQKKAPKRVSKLTIVPKKSAKKSKTKIKKCTKTDDDMDDDPDCFYCGEVWSKSKHDDGWIQCSICKRWAHEACSGCDDEDNDFLCEFCA